MEWKEVRLGDVCEIYGRIGFRGYTTNDLVDTPKEGAISLSPKNIINGELNLDQCTYIKWDKYYESPEIMINPNEIIITKTGSSVGRTTFVRRVVHPMTLNPQLVVLKNISENAEFLSYYIKSALFQSVLKSIVVGSAIPTLSQKNLANLIINVPKEVAYQRRIASILSSLDRKIELNNKINADLEEMAQAIFKNWFVDFEPFKDGKFVDSELGMIPEGWKVGSIGDIVEFQNGFAFSSKDFSEYGEYKIITIKSVQDGCLLSEGSSKISEYPTKMPAYCKLQSGDILLSLTGNVGRCCLVTEPHLLLNQRVAKIKAKESFDNSFSYALFRLKETKELLISISRGTAQANLSPVEASKLPMVIPSKDARKKFSMFSDSIMDKIISIHIENRTLSTLRDTLLPRLMSGELEVPE